MKLSEAIREGCKLRKKNVGTFFGEDEGPDGGSCALGAAMEAVGYTFGDFIRRMDFAKVGFIDIDRIREVCPECKEDASMYHVISEHLNDLHSWSREAIAEWVEVIENKLEREAAGSSTAPAEAAAGEPPAVLPSPVKVTV